MLGKLNSKALVLILVVLVAVAAYAIFSKSNAPTSTIPDKLVAFDSSALNRIVITPKEGETYELKKDGENWKLDVHGKLVAIQEATLESSLSSIREAEPKRVITRKQENWTKYELDEGEATEVVFYQDDKELDGVLIGKFDFNQQNRSMSTYARLIGEDEVYLIDGPLAFGWNKASADWRDNKLVSANYGDITKVVSTGSQAFSINKSDLGGWMQQGIDLDSTALQNYIKSLGNITSSSFNDEVAASEMNSPDATLEIYTDTETIILSIFNSAGTPVIQSSANPGSYFNMDQALAGKVYPKATVEAPEALVEE